MLKMSLNQTRLVKSRLFRLNFSRFANQTQARCTNLEVAKKLRQYVVVLWTISKERRERGAVLPTPTLYMTQQNPVRIMADGEGVYGPTEHTEQRLPRVRRRSQWEGPNEEFMKMLLDLGISKNAAEKALFMTDNSSVDAAASWVLDNQELPDLDEPFKSDSFPALEAHAFERSFPLDEMTIKSPYKMVFVVNTELQMGLGKIAAQVGHAAVGLYKILTSKPEKYDYMVSQWEDFGGTKIVLKGNNSAHLFDLEDLAQKAHIPYYLVHDAGKTQVAAGSLTVIGLFGSSSEVGTITGTLLLL